MKWLKTLLAPRPAKKDGARVPIDEGGHGEATEALLRVNASVEDPERTRRFDELRSEEVWPMPFP